MHFEHIVINHGFHCIQLQKEHLSKEGLVGNFQRSSLMTYQIYIYLIIINIYIYTYYPFTLAPLGQRKRLVASSPATCRHTRFFGVSVVVSWKKGFICCLGIPWLWSQGHLCCIDVIIPASMFHYGSRDCDHPWEYICFITVPVILIIPGNICCIIDGPPDFEHHSTCIFELQIANKHPWWQNRWHTSVGVVVRRVQRCFLFSVRIISTYMATWWSDIPSRFPCFLLYDLRPETKRITHSDRNLKGSHILRLT